MQKARLYIDIEFDPAKGSAENIAQWLGGIINHRLLCEETMMDKTGLKEIPGVRLASQSTIAIIVAGGMIQSVLTDDGRLSLNVLVVDHDTDDADLDDMVTIAFPEDDGGIKESDALLYGEQLSPCLPDMKAILAARKEQLAKLAQTVGDPAEASEHTQVAVAGAKPADITLVEVSVDTCFDTCFDDAIDRRAAAEGWGLFHVHGRGYEIERIDCPEGSCEDDDGGALCAPLHLDSDAVAIDLCLRKALGGSAMHLLALMMEQMPAGKKLYLPQWFLDQAKDM
jgi:hypothetical protein